MRTETLSYAFVDDAGGVITVERIPVIVEDVTRIVGREAHKATVCSHNNWYYHRKAIAEKALGLFFDGCQYIDIMRTGDHRPIMRVYPDGDYMYSDRLFSGCSIISRSSS